MLRKLQKALPGSNNSHKNDSFLPGGAYNAPAKRKPLFRTGSGGGGSFHDGSASSIHTTPTLRQAWQRAPPAVKATWLSLLGAVLMIWMGWRWVRYSSAGIALDCHSTTCELKVTPVGWKKRVVIDQISRSQLHTATAVKTLKSGVFVTDQNIVLTEPYDRNRKNKYKKNKQSNYKGPDENGHYLSYAIVLRDKEGPAVNNDGANQNNEEPPPPEADLRLAIPYMERFTKTETVAGDAKDPQQQQQQQQQHQVLYRLIPRQFGVKQSKRRVRTMIQKVESYVKRRRQKLTIRESSPPSWQGVLLMVFGCIGLVLTGVLGHFAEESSSQYVRGPGVRRSQTHHARHPPHTVADAYAPATPSQYEVSTVPHVPHHPQTSSSSASSQVQKTGFRRNTTQVRKRPGT